VVLRASTPLAAPQVRGASVGMRGGRVGRSDELVGERRLLEIGAGHGLSGVLRDVQLRLLSYWDLLGDDVISPDSINMPDLEVRCDPQWCRRRLYERLGGRSVRARVAVLNSQRPVGGALYHWRSGLSAALLRGAGGGACRAPRTPARPKARRPTTL
jgi:hypothetical protein